MSDVKIDLEAVNPMFSNKEPEEIKDVMVVFVPHEDTELRVNQTVKQFRKGIGARVTRDEARILLDAGRGWIKD